MKGQISKEVQVQGTWVKVQCEITVTVSDDSFDHEFGTEHQYSWEFELGDVTPAEGQDLSPSVKAEVLALDATTVWTTKELNFYANDMKEDETPDVPEDDDFDERLG